MSHHRPVCVKDGREMRPVDNDAVCVDTADFGPCQIWCCDKWRCPECGFEMLVGFGQGPFAEHYQEDFDKILSEVRANRKTVVDSKQ